MPDQRKIKPPPPSLEIKYRALFDKSPIGIGVSDPEGHILEANRSLEEITGYSLSELQTVGVGAMYADLEDRKRLLDALERQGRVRDWEVRHKRKDGSLYYALLNIETFQQKGRRYFLTIIRDITDKKLAEEKILIYRNKLKSLASQLTQAEEQQWKKISSELHDHVGQYLALSKIKIQSLLNKIRDNDLLNTLEEIFQLTDQTIQYVRGLVSEISPPLLHELGLASALGSLAEQTQKNYGIQVACQVEGILPLLSEEIRFILYRAVRELLINAVKHAQARQVEIRLQHKKGLLTIQVEDDGIGFDIPPSNPPINSARGFGLFNIYERLDHIGGVLLIHSEPGRGTRVTLVSPLTRDSKTAGG